MKNKKARFFIIFLVVVFSLINSNCSNPFMIQILEPKTVTFETNGGSFVPSQTLVKGRTVIRPEDPEKFPYVFDGWYLDNGTFNTEWDFGIVPTGDITLYAKWTDVNEYTDGSKEFPFKVYDVATLKYVGRKDENPEGYKGWTLDANYELIADIDLSGAGYWTPIGTFAQGFTGTFNGNGKIITGLTITMYGMDSSRQGMFGTIAGNGTVENLALVSCTIDTNYNGVGGVAGENFGTVRFCSVSGNITGLRDTVGGIVGENGGTVENCYSTATVVNKNDGYGSSVGGVVGSNSNTGIVQNCYATGTIEGDDYVGGVVGGNSGTVRNCVALNQKIEAMTGTPGRVVGHSETITAIMNKNYGNSEMTLVDQDGTGPATSNNSDDTHGMDVSRADYNTPNWWQNPGNWSSGGAWDFTSIWEWDSVAKLPELRNVGGQ